MWTDPDGLEQSLAQLDAVPALFGMFFLVAVIGLGIAFVRRGGDHL